MAWPLPPVGFAVFLHFVPEAGLICGVGDHGEPCIVGRVHMKAAVEEHHLLVSIACRQLMAAGCLKDLPAGPVLQTTSGLHHCSHATKLQSWTCRVSTAVFQEMQRRSRHSHALLLGARHDLQTAPA